MRTAVLLIPLLLAGCSNPWADGYQRNPLLGKARFSPTPSAEIRDLRFERLQTFGRTELVIARAATRPGTQPALFARQSTQTRLLNVAGLTADQVTLIGWSEFENWELLNHNEPRLQRLAQRVGADVVLVSSAHFNKARHDIVRPRTIWLNAAYPPSTRPTLFEARRPRVEWFVAGSEPDKYLYDVLFFKRK